MAGVVAGVVERTMGRFVRRLDVALPGRVVGLYLVGSVALGAFRAGRSDIDFVAVVDGGLGPVGLRRLRRVHHRMFLAGCLAGAAHRCWPMGCNGVFVGWSDLRRSAVEVTPLAAQVAGRFSVGAGFDANPVTWAVLARHGVAVRGPQPATLAIPVMDGELRRWCVLNLLSYWRPWAAAARRRRMPRSVPAAARRLAWAVLGAPRLHYTIRTGQILSKEQAGQYALDVYGSRWHGLINDALAYWRALPSTRPRRHRAELADFVDLVIDTALTDYGSPPRS